MPNTTDGHDAIIALRKDYEHIYSAILDQKKILENMATKDDFLAIKDSISNIQSRLDRHGDRILSLEQDKLIREQLLIEEKSKNSKSFSNKFKDRFIDYIINAVVIIIVMLAIIAISRLGENSFIPRI